MAKALDIRITNAQLNISNNLRRFRMERTQPSMEISRQTPKFQVNWDQVFSESGLETPRYFMNSTKQEAYQKVLRAIGKIAAEGDMKANITKSAPENTIAQISMQNMRAAIPEVNMTTMPKNLAEVTWDKGVFEINWTKGSLDVSWDEDYMPDYSVTPYSVEISIRDLGKLWVPEGDNRGPEGRTLDKKI